MLFGLQRFAGVEIRQTERIDGDDPVRFSDLDLGLRDATIHEHGRSIIQFSHRQIARAGDYVGADLHSRRLLLRERIYQWW